MLSKCLIQFSVEGWGCVPSLLFDLRPNYGGGNEVHCYILKWVLLLNVVGKQSWLSKGKN